jgi:hypothetical protein
VLRTREARQEVRAAGVRKALPEPAEEWAAAEYRPEWRGVVDYSYRKK